MELGELLGDTCSAYVDDVVIFSDGDLEDHWNKVAQVLERLEKAKLKLDPSKFEFAKKEIKYLGFIINVDEGVKVDPEKIAAISAWEAPTDLKGVRSFLGFANFYRGFIEAFAEVSARLQALTKKGAPFRWTELHQKSFEKLKSLFITAPVLALWDGERKTVLETDASGWATGGCLLQSQPGGQLRPIAYYSKKLTPAECNYDIHDKELLAIIRCLNEWRSELLGVKEPFLILTDHNNLKYFMSTKRLSERQVRWSQILSQFNFKLKFRAGKLSGRPDALSRRAQDVPKSNDDPRLKEREFALIRESWMPTENLQVNNIHDSEKANKLIPRGDQLFEEEELQELWNIGVMKDIVMMKELYNTM
ncbi:hypothetical protein K3495_g11312 [Podosphaera aphanis]|nr:hypothetical protein K3495_g11312 [Podosphaera aphanis]